MRLFVWDSSLLTGNKEVDDQHMYLFQLGSEFNQAILSGGKSDLAIKLIEKLVQYAVHHFQCEEDWMRSVDYPRLEAHNHLHNELKKHLAEKLVGFKNGHLPLNASLSIFLQDWITHHILEQDMPAIRWSKENSKKGLKNPY